MAAAITGRVEQRVRPRWIKRVKQGIVCFVAVVATFATVCGAIYFPIYQEARDNAANIDSKLVVQDSKPSVILSEDGVKLFSISMVRRKVVDVMSLPSYVRYAVVAAEDRRFFEHRGVDLVGLARVAVVALRDRHASQGASTIDMQLAKQLVNGDAHSFSRKLKDIATAQQIEAMKTKAEILNLYMNEVYFGEGAYGIEAAAETYFGKPAKDLTISEAAILARCVRTPSKTNPFRDLNGFMKLRDYVLGVMQEEHWIDESQYQAALAEVPKLNPNPPEGARYVNAAAGYFVDHALSVIRDDFPSIDLKEGGYKIVTTLNYKLQVAANHAVSQTLKDNADQKVNDAALVVMDSEGRIRAEVGGPNYRRTKFNVITSGLRQPGSSFKPFVYASAMKAGVVHMGDMVSNEAIDEYDPTTHVHWRPRNNGREHIGGYMSLTSAIAQSYNLPAIHTIQKVGAITVANDARDIFGFHSHFQRWDSLAIGTSEVNPLEMAEGYSVFMLKGDRVRPFPVEKVIGPDGSVLRQYTPTRFSGVLDPAICQNMDTLLEGVVLHGTGYAAHNIPDARGKTGTTQDAKDAWFCGYTDGLLGVGWVGHSVTRHGRPYALPMRNNVYGGTVTAGMWANVMGEAHRLKLTIDPSLNRIAAVGKVKPEVTDSNKEDTAADDQALIDKMSKNAPPLAPQQAPNSSIPASTPPPGPSSTDPTQTPGQDPATAVASKPGSPTPKAATTATKDDDADYVNVEVCADTGLKASIYCPETITRRFKKGTEPKQVCRLHTGNK